MTEQAPAPITRRELRRAGALVAAGEPITRRGRREARRAAERRARRRRRRTEVASVATGLALAALVSTGLQHVRADQAVMAQAEAEAQAVVAAALETQRSARVEHAATARLDGQAAAYAAVLRAEALEVAQAAVERASEVVLTAAPLLDEQELSPLDQAVADLAALIEATAPVPVRGEVETTAATAAAADAPPTTQASPQSPVIAEQPVVADVSEPVTTDLAAADLAATGPAAASELEASTQMIEAAALVADLSAAIEASADAALAQVEAEQAAAAELARRVTAAQEAENGAIPVDVLCDLSFASTALLRCDAAAALEELNEAYRAEFGRDLRVISSYRDLPGQVAVRQTHGSLAATPGMSNHGRGIAVDFGGFGGLGDFSSANYRWMTANAGQFGWFHPVIMQPGGSGPQEPWHWEFGAA